MHLSSLQNIPIATLAQAFNSAFSDYLVPMHLTADDLTSKFSSENTNLELSVGVFDIDVLVGFIFIGTETRNQKTVLYNGGTGVIPEYRGQKLTEKMYDYLLNKLKNNSESIHLLEVITENKRAIKVYETVGFKTKRIVSCFKGIVTQPKISKDISIKPIPFEAVHQFENQWEVQPSYQNSSQAINRTNYLHEFLGAFVGDSLVGYIIFSRTNGRVKQLFINSNYRNQGIGHCLFHQAQEIIETKPVSLINIDSSHTKSIQFLKKIGLQETVQQFEMEFQNA